MELCCFYCEKVDQTTEEIDGALDKTNWRCFVVSLWRKREEREAENL